MAFAMVSIPIQPRELQKQEGVAWIFTFTNIYILYVGRIRIYSFSCYKGGPSKMFKGSRVPWV